ncbi:MAG TPA: DUF3011 domain-containing protein [Lysobacter sp.]|jgi:hypothetical protein|nr:DUF3011 domain-containing protein [Lysobacter sp.]
MRTLFKPLLAALCLFALSTPALAQIQQRAYAPEDLRELSYNDQVRVISLEYQEQSSGRRIPDDQLRFYLDQINRSNWTFSRIKEDIARSLGGSVGPGPGSGPGYIRCESTDGRSRVCPTPWQGRSRLSRQLSGTSCQEGRNWSTQFGQVSVWSGCRAEFVEDTMPGPGIGDTVRCESTNNRTRTCPTPWQGRSRLVRQVSGTSCAEGRTWNSQNGQVTVWGGCRAEFASARGGNGGGGYSVTCSSKNGRYTTCNWAPGQGQPQLLQQLSSEPCIRGSSWGIVNRNTIWVSRGCRARFGN